MPLSPKLPGLERCCSNVNWAFRTPVRPGGTITGGVDVIAVRTHKPITTVKTTVTPTARWCSMARQSARRWTVPDGHETAEIGVELQRAVSPITLP